MKLVLILMAICAATIGFSQNYQTIKSNEVQFFGTNSLNYILATRTDSVQLAGLDSVFYSYKTLRYNDTATTMNCEMIAGPNWYGEKVIIRPDGENIFFNEMNDTIHIETLAALNDTFMVYLYPTGKFIKGTVSSIDTMTVLGSLDSVKTIDLFSDTTLNLTNPKILLGKNSGLVSFFAPYSFPQPYTGIENGWNILSSYSEAFMLIGSQYPEIGINKLTRGELFDFDSGDRFVHSTYTYDMAGGGEWSKYYRERDVLSKTLYGSDSVSYVFHDTVKSSYGYYSDIINTSYYGGDGSVTYTNLDQYQYQGLPEELDLQYGDNWSYMFVNSCNKLEEVYHAEGVGFSDPANSPCLFSAGLSWYSYNYHAIGGVGYYGPEGYTNPGFAEYTNLNISYIYKSADGSSCGTNSILGISNLVFESDALVLYPNPTNGELIIRYSATNEEDFLLTVIDLSGKLIYSEKVNPSQLNQGYTMDLSAIESGIYLVCLGNGNQMIQQKIIKN